MRGVRPEDEKADPGGVQKQRKTQRTELHGRKGECDWLMQEKFTIAWAERSGREPGDVRHRSGKKERLRKHKGGAD